MKKYLVTFSLLLFHTFGCWSQSISDSLCEHFIDAKIGYSDSVQREFQFSMLNEENDSVKAILQYQLTIFNGMNLYTCPPQGVIEHCDSIIDNGQTIYLIERYFNTESPRITYYVLVVDSTKNSLLIDEKYLQREVNKTELDLFIEEFTEDHSHNNLIGRSTLTVAKCNSFGRVCSVNYVDNPSNQLCELFK
jgi:hypothetical protein